VTLNDSEIFNDMRVLSATAELFVIIPCMLSQRRNVFQGVKISLRGHQDKSVDLLLLRNCYMPLFHLLDVEELARRNLH